MANSYTGSQSGQSGLNVTEIDGAPDVFGVTKIIVSNTTLTDNGDGSVTITTGGGGGGGSPGGGNGTVQYNDGGSFGGVVGVTSTGSNVTYETGTIQVSDIADGSGNQFLAPENAGETIVVGAGASTITTLYANNTTPLKLYGATPNGIVVGDSSANSVVAGSGPFQLTLTTDIEGGSDSAELIVANGTNADIYLTPHDIGSTVLGGSSQANLTTADAIPLILSTNRESDSASLRLGSGTGENSVFDNVTGGSIILSVDGVEGASISSHSAGAVSLKNNAYVEDIAVAQELSQSQSGGILLCSDSFSLTLPDATAAFVGWQAAIIAAGGDITVNRAVNSQTLNGQTATNKTISDGKAATLVCIGADQWWLFGAIS